MRSSKPITVTLGSQQKSLDARLQSGAYSSASEVIRAALRALDREEDAIDEIMRRKIREAIDDPGSDIDAGTVFERLERLHAERLKAGRGGVESRVSPQGREGSVQYL
ncbi:type II toxin-antitoxin system ParD family antitoxin [Rhizobium sp. CBN3]|uniref:type II toxin-antitoxin system ParD family antitoxin n=1 Tax=Rhizobium sp. CBN3 TaxID=3058045 RepID=UPI002673DE6A|nr:type II toxin-antitoxin system ParD family antitoxin [Rhizobium sp. CBN3]MDO3434499.1 type II toxin-antitoxin system ParD family antitoxin [Rhizobium sp. CBN3]